MAHPVYALVCNAAVLVLLSVIYEVTHYALSRSRLRDAVTGFLVALTSVAVMTLSYEMAPGVIFDTRSILLSVTALVFEPLTTFIALVGAVAYRFYLGGEGAVVGALVILSSTLIGLIWRLWIGRRTKLHWFHVYLFGLFVHLAMLACLSFLPSPRNREVVTALAPPVMAIYPAATVLLTMLLTKQEAFWKMKSELEESRERFRLLFDKAPLAYQTLDREGRIIEVNPRWLETFGYARNEVIGRPFSDFLSPKDREIFHSSIFQLVGLGVVHREMDVVHKSGRLVTVSYDGEAVRDKRGTFTQACCILRDITEQKKAEMEALERDRKLRQFITAMSQGVVSLDAGGRIVYANPEARRILGRTEAELMGLTPEDPFWRPVREDGTLMPPEELPSLVALRTGKPCGPKIMGVFNPAAQNTIWLSVNAAPIYEADGTLSQVYTVFQDITPGMKARRDYELLFHSMVDAFALHEIIWDEDGRPVDYRFLAVNPAFEQFTGMKAADILGKRVREVLPDLDPTWIEIYGQVAQTGQSARFEQYDKVTGKHYQVMAYRPAPGQFACTFTDDTSRIQAEQQSRRTLARLRGLIDNSDSIILIFDEKGVIAEASAAVEQLTGRPRSQIIGETLHSLGLLDILSQASRLTDFDAGGAVDTDVFELKIGDETRYFESRLFPIETQDESEILFGYLGFDVTDRVRAQMALKVSQKRYSSYIENAPYGVFLLDEAGRFLESNKAASRITGHDRERILRMSFWDFTAPESLEEARRRFRELLETGRMTAELQYVHSSGAHRWWRVDAVRIEPGRYLTFSIDVTDRKKAEADLIRLSKLDFLTGVYNRRFFEMELERMDREGLYPLSVIIGDINGVKFINDAFGHSEGDRYIAETARILRNCCREGDVLARTGGDEFAILLPETDGAEAQRLIYRMQAALEKYDRENAGGVSKHSISLGCATKYSPEEDIREILKLAEGYMYQHKLLEQNSTHSAIVASIKATLFEKSHETEEHARRLVTLTKAVGVAMGMPQSELDKLELLATLHDIGKVGIRDEILTKPGPLNDLEWEEMKRHPEIGYRIAKSSPELAPIAEGILCHHEWWDGSGYPQGILGEEIPLISRIVAVVDAYDAMTNDRPYRKALDHAVAIERIRRNAGTQFDPAVVRVFVELFSEEIYFGGAAI